MAVFSWKPSTVGAPHPVYVHIDLLCGEQSHSNDANKLTILSDCEKGLRIVVNELVPHAHRGHCAQHMAENVKTRYG